MEDEIGEVESQGMDSVNDLVSFLDHGYESEGELNTRKLVAQMNRKKKKSGGFQSMGLSHPVFKGVIRKGYKVPTPIQRKCVPVIMGGRDVVAMARTGSGKTAAFLIPLFEKLQTRSSKAGARGLLLSPTRELALQTLQFIKELGKFTSLKSACILGGSKIDDQFEALHGNPDIIVATPGRLMHVLMEMDLRLSSVEYVVFDEADRLFELGFQEQLQEIISRLPSERQTLLFSATLPKQLVEFAKAGLNDPTLIRLDVDSKLSEQLKLTFLFARCEDKPAVLVHMLRNIVKPHEQTVVFAATKHHVEYIRLLLSRCGIDCSYVYSSLDQTERKINIGKFRNKKTMVLLVTDVAARGLDIPMLDNAINYNFPAKSKLFVHRVGRVARAGRTGTAYSLISPDEVAYLIDLHLFLGRSLNIARSGKQYENWEDLFGRAPQVVIDDENTTLRIFSEENEIANLLKVSTNAYKQYIRSRPVASSESIKRAKAILEDKKIGIHPAYRNAIDSSEELRQQLLTSMKSYKPNSTIFEIGSTGKSSGFKAMQATRKQNEKYIEKYQNKKQKLHEEEKDGCSKVQIPSSSSVTTEEYHSLMGKEDNTDKVSIGDFAGSIRKRKNDEGVFELSNKKMKKLSHSAKDEEHYINYKPKDHHTESGLSLDISKSSFEHEASGAVLDLMGDDDKSIRKQKGQRKVWDRKKKKFVQLQSNMSIKNGKIHTESGAIIKKSYKKNIYQEWKDKTKQEEQDEMTGEDGGGATNRRGFKFNKVGRRGQSGPRVKSELKRPDEILKERKERERKMQRGRGGGSSRGRGGPSRGGGSSRGHGGPSRGGGRSRGPSRGGPSFGNKKGFGAPRGQQFGHGRPSRGGFRGGSRGRGGGGGRGGRRR
uniref:ATP-dependent RNA helicase DDX54-like n=1 Tax=Styela clava TaxID=7725 RepID=UPI00193A5CBD|nr:ATP-dependent RNA helicase DDX54-like [Styela clava]